MQENCHSLRPARLHSELQASLAYVLKTVSRYVHIQVLVYIHISLALSADKSRSRENARMRARTHTNTHNLVSVEILNKINGYKIKSVPQEDRLGHQSFISQLTS